MSTPYPNLFKPLKVDGLSLKNRITMAPLYLGYAGSGGKVSPLILSHYKLMAQSGAAFIVVEGARITMNGCGSARTLGCDHNRYLKGLEKLAGTIKEENAFAGFQINHAGRFAQVAEPVAPSAVPVFGKTPHPLTTRQIRTIQKQYARAALRVKKAGLHGLPGSGHQETCEGARDYRRSDFNPSTCRLDHQRKKGRPDRSCPHALGGSRMACQGPPRARQGHRQV